MGDDLFGDFWSRLGNGGGNAFNGPMAITPSQVGQNYQPIGGGPEDGPARWAPIQRQQPAPAPVQAPQAPLAPVQMRQPGTNAFAPPTVPPGQPDTPALISNSLRQPVNALVPPVPASLPPASQPVGPTVSQDTLTPQDRALAPLTSRPVSAMAYARGDTGAPNLPPMRSANYMTPGNTFGLPGQHIQDVSAGGYNFQTHKLAAPAMTGFVNDLKEAGAPIGAVGGYNPRPGGIAGTGRLSQHSMGNAIDIFKQTGRNQIDPAARKWVQDNPEKWNAILQKWNMRDGGTFGGRLGPDLGHVEWMGPRQAAQRE